MNIVSQPKIHSCLDPSLFEASLDMVSPSVFFFINMVQIEKLFLESDFFRSKSRMESARESQLSEALSSLTDGASEFSVFAEVRDRNDAIGDVNAADSVGVSTISIELGDASSVGDAESVRLLTILIELGDSTFELGESAFELGDTDLEANVTC